jgi:hypothetical protein
MKTKKEYQKPTMGIVKYPSKPLLESTSNTGQEGPAGSRSTDFHNWENE